MNIINQNIAFKIFDKSFTQSTHIYEFEPLAEGVQIEDIKKNHRAVVDDLGAEALLVLKEVHGSTVVHAEDQRDLSLQMEADGSITQTPGVALSIQTADCVPVLLASANGRVIGSAHCGWRSAKADILRNVVLQMKSKGADILQAIMGPAIHQENYEVDHLFYEELTSREPVEHLFIRAEKARHYYFDLPGYVIFKLHDLGITNIINCCENTYSNPEKYFSYRRDTQRGITLRQNILSTIMIMRSE